MIYTIQFLDFWNSSSGLAGGAKADELCLRDADELPYLPGKTVKGLLRDTAELLHVLDNQTFSKTFLHTVFGQRTDNLKQDDFAQASKGIFFSNAYIDKKTAEVLKGKEDFLFEELASTALDANGIANTSTLRRIQYALPCTLYGTINGIPSEYTEPLQQCAQMVKRLGRSRHRGFGRCVFTILKETGK